MSTNDYDVVTGRGPTVDEILKAAILSVDPRLRFEDIVHRRRTLYDIMREHRQRLADAQARRDAAQARRDAARDRLWGRPAFTILPREE